MSDLRTAEQLEADDIASEARAGEARYNGPDYDYDEEMENAENPCCAECAYWDAYALKQGINRAQMDNIRATQIGNLSTDCRVYKAIADETRRNLLAQCGVCPDCEQPYNSEAHFGQECVNFNEDEFDR